MSTSRSIVSVPLRFLWVIYPVVVEAATAHDSRVPTKSASYAYAPPLIALGDAIRRARKAVNLSQEALALECGLDRSYVGGVERGEQNVTIVNLGRIAAGLGTMPSQLLASAGL
jgi:ribosome-binding protein aMBF1 (putative translation factor)